MNIAFLGHMILGKMKRVWKRMEVPAMFVICLILVGLFMDQSRFPMYFHAWTQADQYALALGFERNGLDFFHPETFVLNPQFPGEWEVPGETGITAVDFPIHSYIPAVLMKILGTRDVAVFRWYVLFMAFLGIHYLWRLARALGLSNGQVMFVAVFMTTLPVFFYYSNAPMVSIPALTCAWIGFYYWAEFQKVKNGRYWWTAIFWLTLAALSRSTFLIPLLAVLGAEAWQMWLNRKFFVRIILGFFLSLLAIGAFAWHNHDLRIEFGSAFLSALMPPSSWQEAVNLTQNVLKRWLLDWFSWIHIACLIVLIFTAFWHRYKFDKTSKADIFTAAKTLMVIGSLAFYVAMMRQFVDHDYYFLDAFALPLGLFVISLIKRAFWLRPEFGKSLWAFILTIAMVGSAMKLTEERNMDVPWDRVSATVRNFSGSDIVLDQMGISRQSRILVIDAYAPNIPLTLADRQGFVVMTTSRENMERALGWPFDIGIFQNQWLESDILVEWPHFLDNITVIKKTDQLTFFNVKSKTNQ